MSSSRSYLPPLLSLTLIPVLGSGCGLITSDRDDSQDDAGGEGGSNPPLLCGDGEERLSEETCTEGGRVVEVCSSERWTPSAECSEPDDCAGEVTRETGEQCGDYFFNRRLEKCAGEIWQPAGCSCGSENPTHDGTDLFGRVDEQADVEHLRGVTFPLLLSVTAPVTGLEHIRCVGMTWAHEKFEELPGIFAVDSLTGGDFSGLSGLRYVRWLDVGGGGVDLQGLESVVEIRDILFLSSSSRMSLNGLDSLQRIGTVQISYSERLNSVQALSNITAIDGNLSIDNRESLESLRGLHNVETIAGDMTLVFNSKDDFENLRRLKSIGGDVQYGATGLNMKCTAAEFFSHIEIGGEISGSGLLHELDVCP